MTQGITLHGPVYPNGRNRISRKRQEEDSADQPDEVKDTQDPKKGQELVAGGAPGDSTNETTTVGTRNRSIVDVGNWRLFSRCHCSMRDVMTRHISFPSVLLKEL